MNTTPRVRAALLVLAAAALLGVGLHLVHRRHQVVRVGYQLSEARAELRQLQEERNRLRLEESVLTNPARIERLATSLGMLRPAPNQLRVIPSKNSVALRK
ncbi:MAG: cell division protein FtsL [Myxococcales bacterium]|nr:cell division protein FtsL [Myxococcales bacterium]